MLFCNYYWYNSTLQREKKNKKSKALLLSLPPMSPAVGAAVSKRFIS